VFARDIFFHLYLVNRNIWLWIHPQNDNVCFKEENIFLFPSDSLTADQWFMRKSRIALPFLLILQLELNGIRFKSGIPVLQRTGSKSGDGNVPVWYTDTQQPVPSRAYRYGLRTVHCRYNNRATHSVKHSPTATKCVIAHVI